MHIFCHAEIFQQRSGPLGCIKMCASTKSQYILMDQIYDEKLFWRGSKFEIEKYTAYLLASFRFNKMPQTLRRTTEFEYPIVRESYSLLIIDMSYVAAALFIWLVDINLISIFIWTRLIRIQYKLMGRGCQNIFLKMYLICI